MSQPDLSHFATTVQQSVARATVIEPRSEVLDASVEYCVSSGYVRIKDEVAGRSFVTHISNVVLEIVHSQ